MSPDTSMDHTTPWPPTPKTPGRTASVLSPEKVYHDAMDSLRLGTPERRPVPAATALTPIGFALANERIAITQLEKTSKALHEQLVRLGVSVTDSADRETLKTESRFGLGSSFQQLQGTAHNGEGTLSRGRAASAGMLQDAQLSDSGGRSNDPEKQDERELRPRVRPLGPHPTAYQAAAAGPVAGLNRRRGSMPAVVGSITPAAKASPGAPASTSSPSSVSYRRRMSAAHIAGPLRPPGQQQSRVQQAVSRETKGAFFQSGMPASHGSDSAPRDGAVATSHSQVETTKAENRRLRTHLLVAQTASQRETHTLEDAEARAMVAEARAAQLAQRVNELEARLVTQPQRQEPSPSSSGDDALSSLSREALQSRLADAECANASLQQEVDALRASKATLLATLSDAERNLRALTGVASSGQERESSLSYELEVAKAQSARLATQLATAQQEAASRVKTAEATAVSMQQRRDVALGAATQADSRAMAAAREAQQAEARASAALVEVAALQRKLQAAPGQSARTSQLQRTYDTSSGSTSNSGETLASHAVGLSSGISSSGTLHSDAHAGQCDALELQPVSEEAVPLSSFAPARARAAPSRSVGPVSPVSPGGALAERRLGSPTAQSQVNCRSPIAAPRFQPRPGSSSSRASQALSPTSSLASGRTGRTSRLGAASAPGTAAVAPAPLPPYVTTAAVRDANHKRVVAALTCSLLAGPAHTERLASAKAAMASHSHRQVVLALVAPSGSAAAGTLAGVYMAVEQPQDLAVLDSPLPPTQSPSGDDGAASVATSAAQPPSRPSQVLAIRIWGAGPLILSPGMLQCLLKYDTASRGFREVGGAGCIRLSASADACGVDATAVRISVGKGGGIVMRARPN